MSNLGAYQDFTTAAKKAGGVTKALSLIERNAVDAAKPGLLAKGGVGGFAAAVAVGAAGLVGKRYLDKRKADQASADEAKRQLEADFGEGVDEPEPGSDD